MVCPTDAKLLRESGPLPSNTDLSKRDSSLRDPSFRVRKSLKVWWRFIESEASVDQEFFYQLPNRKHSTLVRTEGGGFRFSTKQVPHEEDLLIQGTSFVTAYQLAALICSWTSEHPTRITVGLLDHEVLEFGASMAEDPSEVEARILGLVEMENGPLRVCAVDSGLDEGQLVPESDLPLEGMVLTAAKGLEGS